MDNEPPNIALYLNCDDPFSLLLDPPAGAQGTVEAIARRAKNESESIDIPFLSFEQDVLLYVLKHALNEPQRGRGRTANAARPPKHLEISALSPNHHIFKSWLQYFRAIVLKKQITEIASILEIAVSTYRKWERPSTFLPPPYWFELLWRWYIACYAYILRDRRALEEPERLPTWETTTSLDERLGLIKRANPRYFHQLDLKKRQGA